MVTLTYGVVPELEEHDEVFSPLVTQKGERSWGFSDSLTWLRIILYHWLDVWPQPGIVTRTSASFFKVEK